MRNKKTLILKLATTATVAIPFASMLTSCATPEPEVQKDFCSDSWENIVYWANQGSDALIKRYGVLETIIGRERILNVDGVDHIVRVIGMDSDYIADSEGKPTEKTATLTFQFEEIFSCKKWNQQFEKEIIEPCPLVYYDEVPVTDVGYHVSNIREFQNNDLLSKLPKTLQEGIKTVSKDELVSDKQVVEDLETEVKLNKVPEKLFSLSFAEMLPSQYFGGSNLRSIYAKEGRLYDWYQFLHVVYGPYDLTDTNPLFSKWPACGPIVTGPGAWFVRTIGFWPQFEEEQNRYLSTTCFFNSLGSPTTDYHVNDFDCILPCFCI